MGNSLVGIKISPKYFSSKFEKNKIYFTMFLTKIANKLLKKINL